MFSLPQVELQILNVFKALIPLILAFYVHCTDSSEPSPTKICHDMASDEPTAAGNRDQHVIHSKYLLFVQPTREPSIRLSATLIFI